MPKSNILHGGVETTPPPSLVCGVGIVLNPDNFLLATRPSRTAMKFYWRKSFFRIIIYCLRLHLIYGKSTNMRILLVQAFLGRKEKPIYPIGLATLASVLKNHEVKVVDPNIMDDPEKDLKKTAGEFQPDIIGISLRNVDTTQVRDPFIYFNGMRESLSAVKSVCPKAGIVIGGSGFSIYAEEIMRAVPEIQIGVHLEAESTFPELVEKYPEVENIKGIFHRKDGEVIFTGKRDFPQTTDIPSPNYDIVPIEPYKDLLDAVGIQTKRGCALCCVYCNYPMLNGRNYRFRDPMKVADDIERLVKEFGLKRFIFVDSVFNIPRDHAEAVMNEIIDRKLDVKWTGWYNEKALDREFVELALKAGCEFFSFSPDGYSNRTLKALGKNLRTKDIHKVYKIMKDYPQALVGYNFFLNPPGQTVFSLLILLIFAFRVKLTFGSRSLGLLLGSIRIEPDTPIYERALKEGFITKDTPMLAPTSEELINLFYKPPHSWMLSMMLKLYIFIRKLKHKIRPPRDL